MAFYLLLLPIIGYLFIIIKRGKKYKYNVRKDYIYNIENHLLETLILKKNTLTLPKKTLNYDTLFLKISLSHTIKSLFFKPYIVVEEVKHYFEYGAQGIRYINISNTKRNILSLKCYNTTLSNKDISLYAFKNEPNLSEKILILAPHADDAELAAFGLYKTAKNVTIVTSTAAEEGICNYCDIYKGDRTKQALKKAELRAYDALSVGLLGGVAVENSIALGYFGGSLHWMSKHPQECASSIIENINNMNLFRKTSHANIKLNSHVQATYNSFLEDLTQIVTQLKPSIIITPHPAIDSHPDHKQTTLALLEVLKKTQLNTNLYLYTNHLELSETYPLGSMHTPISLPPAKESFYFDSIYSFALGSDLQIDKFFALEAMHDLRNSLLVISIKDAYKHLRKMLKRKITSKDKSYYKRAVRSNELFFIVNTQHIDKLTEI